MRYILVNVPDDPHWPMPIWGTYGATDEAIWAAIKWIGKHRYSHDNNVVATEMLQDDTDSSKGWLYNRIDIRDIETGDMYYSIYDGTVEHGKRQPTCGLTITLWKRVINVVDKRTNHEIHAV